MVMLSSSKSRAGRMRRRIYRNPPVHEIVLDLQFAGEASFPDLQNLPRVIGNEFGEAKPITRISTHAFVGPNRTTPTARPPEQAFWGWDMSDTDGERRRITSVTANQLTQHYLRSDQWPAGEYTGWEESADKFLELLQAVGPLFSKLDLQRAGLRYVNRIAVPRESDLETWFSIVPPPMQRLEDLWELSVTRTWKRAKDFPGLSGSVRMRMADDTRPSGTDDDVESQVGVILDIDVFNFWVKDAPKLSEVPEWMESAHSLEHQVFRSCIKPELEQRFGVLEDI